MLDCNCRYLTWFDVFLTNIDITHPGARQLLEDGAIAVARSFIAGCRSPVDKTMEETFMKFSKSIGMLIQNVQHLLNFVAFSFQTPQTKCVIYLF